MTTEPTILNNRYELQEVIGRGAFAEVWRAQDGKLKRPVAVKILEPRLVQLEGDTLVALFQREAQTVAALEHPHIVHVYDVGQQGSQLYLVMELLTGGDLHQKLQAHGPYSLPDALAVLSPIAAALDVAHAAGVIHRDVKPQNILFGRHERPALTDFGLVKLLSRTLYVSSPALSGHNMLGTPGYMAPEQIDEDLGSVSPATDIFALAVILFETLTGQSTFRGSTPHAVHYQTIHTERGKLRDRLPGKLPSAARDLLLAALDADPARRPGGAGEWVAALNEALAAERAAQTRRDAAQRQAAMIREAQQEKVRQLQRRAEEAHRQRQWEELRGLAYALLVEDKKHRQARQWLAEIEQATARPPAPAAQPADDRRTSRSPINLPYIISGKPPLNFDWCYVPAGSFTMGADDSDAYSDEKPVHTLTLPDYYLARFPVTNAQYRLFIEAGGYSQRQWWTSDGWAWREKDKISQPSWWTSDTWNAPNLPVIGVSWYEAAAFCAWAAAAIGEAIRLPTEAEWEKGARGTDKRQYPWGIEPPDDKRCNFNNNVNQTTPLGRYSPQGDSPYGCADMSGNAWEWCATIYKPYPYRPDDGRESPNGTDVRVLRGGSWGLIARSVRASLRLWFAPDSRYNDIGFRCASSAP